MKPVIAPAIMGSDYKPELHDLPRPEPAGGTDYYEREWEKALAFDPRRRDNYRHYMESIHRAAGVDYLPIKLDIENVSRCNFRCTMCVVSQWDKGKRAKDLSLEDFKALIDEQYGLMEIKLQGIGEPTMQGDDFFEMIRYARSKNIWVRTTTNASRLHLRDTYKKLIDSDPNEVQISIDGADKETFESIRQGSVFDRVIENCKLINAYCDEAGVRRTKMWTVVQQKNVHQLEALVDLAKEAGFSNMVFSDMGGWANEEMFARNKEQMVNQMDIVDRLFGLIKQGRALGIDVWFWNVGEKYSTDRPENLCPWPFERSFVGSDLRISPCCMIANPDEFEIKAGGGGKKFIDIWKGDAYRDFRQAHLDGAVPRVCKSCYK